MIINVWHYEPEAREAFSIMIENVAGTSMEIAGVPMNYVISDLCYTGDQDG